MPSSCTQHSVFVYQWEEKGLWCEMQNIRPVAICSAVITHINRTRLPLFWQRLGMDTIFEDSFWVTSVHKPQWLLPSKTAIRGPAGPVNQPNPDRITRCPLWLDCLSVDGEQMPRGPAIAARMCMCMRACVAAACAYVLRFSWKCLWCPLWGITFYSTGLLVWYR